MPEDPNVIPHPAAEPPVPMVDQPEPPSDEPPLGTISAARRVTKGDTDPMGEVVTKVFVSTDHFIIYTAGGEGAEAGRLRYILPDDYASAARLRARLVPISGGIAQVSDVIAGMSGWTARLGWVSQFTTLRARTLDLMARAMQIAFEDEPEAATMLVNRCLEEVVLRRNSRNRMRYIMANLISLLVLLAIFYVDKVGIRFDALANVFKMDTPNRTADVLAFGALGAFFSVSAFVNAVNINHSISIWEMVYAGFVRVPIGVIAAAVVLLLINGGWMLGNVQEGHKELSILLFAFVAGLSEAFVPNALKSVEKAVVVAVPTAKVADGT